jgi:hypothetical protein
MLNREDYVAMVTVGRIYCVLDIERKLISMKEH